MEYASKLTKAEPGGGLLLDSGNFRAKQESRELLDLGDTILEKYG